MSDGRAEVSVERQRDGGGAVWMDDTISMMREVLRESGK